MKNFAVQLVVAVTVSAYLLACECAFAKAPQIQLSDTDQREMNASEYVMRRYSGERLIPVRILAGVRNPGTYYIPEGTDLITLLSLSGGLTSTANAENIRLNEWQSKKMRSVSLPDVMEQPSKYNLSLAPNDVLYIEDKAPAVSNNTMQVISLLSALVGIVAAGFIISKETK